MNLYTTEFPVLASTEGIAFEIYLAGCRGHCYDCHSKHTWNFEAGTPLNGKDELLNLISELEDKKNLFDNVAILGGEPLDHNKEDLLNFLFYLSARFPFHDFYLYTHYKESYVKKIWSEILPFLNFVKVGEYNNRKKNDDFKKDPLTGVTLASTNQYFIEGKREFGKKFKEEVYNRRNGVLNHDG